MKTKKGIPYCVSFDTTEMPGRVVGISIAIGKVFLKDIDSVRVDLCNHPLYEKLETYVLDNPSKKNK